MAIVHAIRFVPAVAKGAMAVSAIGIASLIGHEGLRTTGYLDSVGIPTVCYGHTATAVVGQTLSYEQCEALLASDLAEFSATVNRYVEVPLSQQQFDSLVSFCYNVGSHACRTSTLFRTLNAGDYYGAAQQFDRWKFAQGRDCTIRANNCYGVWTRRMAEKELFLAGTARDNSPLWPVVASGGVTVDLTEHVAVIEQTTTEVEPNVEIVASRNCSGIIARIKCRLADWKA